MAGSPSPVPHRTRRRPSTDPSGRARTPRAGRAEASEPSVYGRTPRRPRTLPTSLTRKRSVGRGRATRGGVAAWRVDVDWLFLLVGGKGATLSKLVQELLLRVGRPCHRLRPYRLEIESRTRKSGAPAPSTQPVVPDCSPAMSESLCRRSLIATRPRVAPYAASSLR